MELLIKKKKREGGEGGAAKGTQPGSTDAGRQESDEREQNTPEVQHLGMKWAALLTTGSTLSYTEVTPAVS